MNDRSPLRPRSLIVLHSLVLLVLLLAPACVGAQPPAATAAAFDAVLKQATRPDAPGASAIVVKDGKVLYRQAYGMANVELGVPLQPDMVFRLGSITKQFTATAIMMLVEQGKVALQDPIEKYLPGYPTRDNVITVEHLLTHTSGIRSYTGIPGWMTSRIKADMTVTELVDAFKNEPMEFAPGTQYRYNNSGYVLLGAVIEKASGESYESFITSRIFKPLGMTHSYYGSNEPIIPRRAAGYSAGGGGVRNAQYLSMTQPYSAGSLVSNVDDLAVWDAAVGTAKLLKPESWQKIWTPYKLADGSTTGYGYGWQLGTLRGHRTIEHGGGIHGFSTYGLRLPDDHVYVAVLWNSDSPLVDPGYLARRLAAIAIGTPYSVYSPVVVDPKILQRYVGVYQVDANTTRTVVVEGGRLFTQRAGGARLEAKPRSQTEFFYDNRLGLFQFELDAAGNVAAMVTFQEEGAKPERAPRVAASRRPSQMAKVDPSLYDQYAGEYQLAPGFILTVTREGDHLMTQATGQAKVEIFPSSETEFFLKVVEARITFVRGAAGKVDQLVLHQNGADMPAKRVK